MLVVNTLGSGSSMQATEMHGARSQNEVYK